MQAVYSRRALLASIAASAVLASGKPVRAAQPTPIRSGWVVVPADLLPIVPAARQLTRHLGTAYVLQPQHFAGTTPMITALAAGAIDTASLAYSSFALAIQNAKMNDIRIIADCFQDGVPGYHTNTYRVLKSSPIKTVAQLKGKVLATNTEGSAVDIAMRVMLRKHHIDDKTDVNIVEAPFPTMKSMLQEGKVDLIPAVLPFSADPQLEAMSRPLFTQEEAIGQTQMIIHTARASFLAQNRAAVTAMLEDMLRLLHYFESPKNHAETVRVVAAVTKQPASRFAGWVFTHKDYYRSPDGLPDLDALQKNINVQKELGYLDTAIDVKHYTDLSLVEEAAKRAAASA